MDNFDELNQVVEEVISPAHREYNVKPTCDLLRIRKLPNLSGEVLDYIKDYQTFKIIDEFNGWGKLEDNRGWVMLSFTQVVE